MSAIVYELPVGMTEADLLRYALARVLAANDATNQLTQQGDPA